MPYIFQLTPTLAIAALSMFLLLLVSGTKYSIKKTLLIVIPATLLVLFINTVIFEYLKLEKVLFWNIMGIFLPEAILTFIIGKRKRLLSYLKDRNLEDYRKLIKALNIRETK